MYAFESKCLTALRDFGQGWISAVFCPRYDYCQLETIFAAVQQRKDTINEEGSRRTTKTTT